MLPLIAVTPVRSIYSVHLFRFVDADAAPTGFVQSPIWRQPTGPGATSGISLDILRFMVDSFGVTSEQGAVTPLWLATAPEPATEKLRGRYWDRKEWQWLAPWALNEQRQGLLWDMWCRDAGAPSL